jgi:UPF0716 protein FxsA
VFLRLLLLFTMVPLVELALLLYLADLTDWRFTLGLVIVTGVVGTILARHEGFRTLRAIRTEMNSGRLPGAALMDAVMIFLAGALLLTPGILTDVFGFSLLLPWCRTWYRRRMRGYIQRHFSVEAHPSGDSRPFQGGSQVIDSYVVDRNDERPPDS